MENTFVMTKFTPMEETVITTLNNNFIMKTKEEVLVKIWCDDIFFD